MAKVGRAWVAQLPLTAAQDWSRSVSSCLIVTKQSSLPWGLWGGGGTQKAGHASRSQAGNSQDDPGPFLPQPGLPCWKLSNNGK